jgi:hypothetical protein
MRSPGNIWRRVPHAGGWRNVPRELLLVMTGLVLYFGVRGLTVGNVDQAVGNAADVVSLERDLDIYIEPRVQDVVNGVPFMTTLMNWVYVWGHWPVIAVTLLWLVLRHASGYRVMRNAMVISGAIGLVVFALFPVAPPRLAGLGLVDTVTEFSTSYRALQPQAFVNQYAAVPSLHVGWDLLVGLALLTYCEHRAWRVIGVVLPCLMAVSVVATANHFVVDVVAGIVVVLVGLAAARLMERRHRGPLHLISPRAPVEDVGAPAPSLRSAG